MKGPAGGLSQQATEAEGSLTPETRGRVGAALTTTGRVGTARRPGSGKQDEKVQRAVNQWWNPRKLGTPAPTWWMWAGQQRATTLLPGGRLQHGVVPAVLEATGKACGVPVARLPGKSWAPPSSTGRW
jgi:L-alanine-DL-glutamate epimerase-like enolase superfamily enzyme